SNPSFESKYVHECNHAFSTTVDPSTIQYAQPGLSAWAAQLLRLCLNKGVHRLAHLKDPSDEVRAYLSTSTNGHVKNACTVSWSEIENFSLNVSISLIQREEKIVWDMAESMAAPTRKGVTVVRQRRPYTPVVFSMINSAIMSQNSHANGYFALAFSVFHFTCQSHVIVKQISCRLGMISHDKMAQNALNLMTEKGQAALQASVASYTAKREVGYCCVLDNIQ
ncbi:hypothetical protein ARMGADRAFT_900203, partial [Armillaria gallica]